MDATPHSLTPIIQAVARRERAAMRALYDSTSAKLFGICLRILPSREEAEDALQDVYVTVWAKAATFDAQRGNPISWLAAIARNKAIDRLRARREKVTEQPLPERDMIADLSPSAIDRMMATQEGQRLQACLDRLNPRSRDAISEAFFGGYTYDALAMRMNVPLGTMKTWVRRGLLSLRTCMEPMNGDLEP